MPRTGVDRQNFTAFFCANFDTEREETKKKKKKQKTRFCSPPFWALTLWAPSLSLLPFQPTYPQSRSPTLNSGLPHLALDPSSRGLSKISLFSPSTAHVRFFFSLGSPIFVFFSLSREVFSLNWPRVAAIDHPNCACGSLGSLSETSAACRLPGSHKMNP